MNLLRAHLMYALSRAGWAGALGLALLAFALAVYFGAAAPLEAERGGLEGERATLAERLSQGRTVESPREQLDRFDASLVARANMPSILEALSLAAARHMLVLARVESRESQPVGAGYGRQEYVFPLHGHYPALRAWLADIQQISPAVLIEEVILRREDIARDGVDASVRLSILMKDAS
jgi:hypothetical protein